MKKGSQEGAKKLKIKKKKKNGWGAKGVGKK